LMITVAIVGILAAVALPAYQDYTIRAQVTEGMSLAYGAKINVVENYQTKGVLPANNTEASYSGATGKYVVSTAVGSIPTNGVITATFDATNSNPKIHGATITLTPVEDTASGVLVWSCNGSVPSQYRPATCK